MDAPVAGANKIFSYSAGIARNKNVFVTAEYFNALLRGLRAIESAQDICSLAYVIMPNYFRWIFRARDGVDDPRPIYGELKKNVAREILVNLMMEVKLGAPKFRVLDFLIKRNVRRSRPQKILEEFRDEAKKYEGRKFRVWDKGGFLKKLENKVDLAKELESLRHRPIAGKVPLADKPEEYPYLYVNEELERELLA